MKPDVLKTTFANFQRLQNLQVHVFKESVSSRITLYRTYTKDDPVPGVCSWKIGGARAQQVMCKNPATWEVVINASAGMPTKRKCDTLSTDGKQPQGADRQMLLGAAWAPFRDCACWAWRTKTHAAATELSFVGTEITWVWSLAKGQLDARACQTCQCCF